MLLCKHPFLHPSACFFFTYNFKSFVVLKCDYIHAEWWRKGCGRINSALLLGSCFLSLFHCIWHGVVVEVTREFLHRPGTGLGLMRRKVPLKGTPHGLILFYCYRSSMDCFLCWTLISSPEASIMSVLLPRDKIRTDEWKLLGIRFLLTVKEQVPHNYRRLTTAMSFP